MDLQKLTWVALVLAVCFSVARADDVDDEDADEDRKIQGVAVKTIFPGQPHDVQVTAGQEAKALVNFENSADTTFQIEFINAHLANANNANEIAQNLTGMFVNRTVNQGESVSMVYKFQPWKELDPKAHNLVLQVYFMSEEENERSSETAFNGTIMVNDGSSLFDAQSVFLAIIIISISALAYTNIKGGKKTTVSKRQVSAAPAHEVGTDVIDGVDYSYVSAAHHRPSSRSPTKKNK
eukprot:TRINITY_DN5441_c0_g1_i8.p1 TRINITY_DN5441_c0_g1~~TRINITY_DN5441_c0_g1_i8.p1  ORF type:complete len:237 (+),score=62.16 TRINITY_DN5441_c0_g1_i8:85-795(+)